MTKPFEGEINYNTFKIQRIIGGRDSFLPVIEGKILKAQTNTEIFITMRMTIYTYTVWLFITGVLFFPIFKIIKIMLLKNHFDSGILIFLAIIVLVYLFALLSFRSESLKAKKLLENLFLDET